MATGGDQISTLVNELEKVSLSKTLYREESIAGKGVGCIASTNIRKGSLVLREVPALFTPNWKRNITDQDVRRSTEAIIRAFLDMSEEEQDIYMKLYNCYDNPTWYNNNSMKKHLELVMHATNNMTFAGISKARACRVWSIYLTNAFNNGVCLNMSRFNHSCRSNADHFWNDDTNTRDVRAVRKIQKGEEITLNYIPGSNTRAERQAKLKENFNFDCNCEACNSTKAQIQNETKSLELYREENKRQTVFHLNAQLYMAFDFETAQVEIYKEAESLKRMYKLAKEIKTFTRRLLLYEVVDNAFELNIQGAINEQRSRNRDEVKAAWMKDAKMFAAIGHTISTTLSGEDHSETKQWEARSLEPTKCFLKEHKA